jgi:hypothetical protein
MDPLELLHARIAGFPGYTGDLERRRADEFVRSYLGEALAGLSARVAPIAPEVQSRLDALVLRVGFAAQKSFALHNGNATLTAVSDAVVSADAATVELADRASSLDPTSLKSYLDEVSAALDRRDETMRAAATAPH